VPFGSVFAFGAVFGVGGRFGVGRWEVVGWSLANCPSLIFNNFVFAAVKTIPKINFKVEPFNQSYIFDFIINLFYSYYCLF
jgi:hypothetical protein